MFQDAILSHYDVVVFMSTTGDPLNAEAAGGVRALHPRGRRLRRRPRRGRHRVRLALVRRSGGRVLPQPPGRHADRDGERRGPGQPLHAGAPEPLAAGGRVVQLPRVRTGRQQDDYSPRAGGVHVLDRARRGDVRRGRRQHDGRRPSDLVVPALRRRPLLVHGHGPHPGDVRRRGLPQAPPRRPGVRGRQGRGRGLRDRRACQRRSLRHDRGHPGRGRPRRWG